MGFSVAAAAAQAGHIVDLVHGPVGLPVPAGVRAHAVVTSEEMLERVRPIFDECDILFMVAAVCDFRPADYCVEKVKKEDVPATARFERTVDILKTLSARKRAGQVLVGFAAETRDIEAYARRKLVEKDLHYIVANRVGRVGDSGENAFEAETNRIVLIGRDGVCLEQGPALKSELARWLVAQVV
jgi:phosphopantothenoylcysteine decarboxylase/phosphopantothenate--cysteine ligase